MRAVVLHGFGKPVTVEEQPDPQAGPGDVVVDVAAAGVLPYANEVLSGERRYALTLPVVPGAGAVGRVRATGPDATRLRPGQWVLVDPTVRSRDGDDITLQGWSARGEGGLILQRHFGNGSWASRVLAPAENVHPLGEIGDPLPWVALGGCLIPYGGLRAAGLRPGETLLVNGATGNIGSTAVAVALAMGAARVVAAGRDRALLDDLAARFGPRVQPVALGDLGGVTGPVDVVLDLLPPAAPASAVRAAAMTVRESGRVVLMGGVGMLGGDDLALPYPWLMRNNVTLRGQWMYPRAANAELIALARDGLLDLGLFTTTAFGLDDVLEAVEHAAAHPRGFHTTVLTP